MDKYDAITVALLIVGGRQYQPAVETRAKQDDAKPTEPRG